MTDAFGPLNCMKVIRLECHQGVGVSVIKHLKYIGKQL